MISGIDRLPEVLKEDGEGRSIYRDDRGDLSRRLEPDCRPESPTLVGFYRLDIRGNPLPIATNVCAAEIRSKLGWQKKRRRRQRDLNQGVLDFSQWIGRPPLVCYLQSSVVLLERSSLYAALNGATDSLAAQRGAIRLLGPDVLQDTWKHELILRMVNLGLAVFEVLMNMIINGSLVHLCIFMASWITLAVHVYWLRNQRRSLILAADQGEVQQIGKATARRSLIVAIGDLPYNGKVLEHELPLHTLLLVPLLNASQVPPADPPQSAMKDVCRLTKVKPSNVTILALDPGSEVLFGEPRPSSRQAWWSRLARGSKRRSVGGKICSEPSSELDWEERRRLRLFAGIFVEFHVLNLNNDLEG